MVKAQHTEMQLYAPYGMCGVDHNGKSEAWTALPLGLLYMCYDVACRGQACSVTGRMITAVGAKDPACSPLQKHHNVQVTSFCALVVAWCPTGRSLCQCPLSCRISEVGLAGQHNNSWMRQINNRGSDEDRDLTTVWRSSNRGSDKDRQLTTVWHMSVTAYGGSIQ